MLLSIVDAQARLIAAIFVIQELSAMCHEHLTP